jgi:hypothetical protein
LQITEEQLSEWTENPVTIALGTLAKAERDRIKDTPIQDCLVHGEPNKTQDNLTELETRLLHYNDLVAFLTGDWSYLLEGEDDEGE